MADPRQVCSGAPEKLAGIWELLPPGAPESSRQAQLHEAFLKSGKSYAKDVWATTSRSLTNYARAWADMYRENCEATVVRKEQSEEVRDLRTSCLSERLGGLRALTDVFSEATGEVVENAVSASNALASLDRCADVPLLRAVVRPPEDLGTKQKVEGLHKRLAQLKARFDAGQWRNGTQDARTLVEDARVVGYEPFVADALALLGSISCKSDNAADAERAYVESFRVADASRHDEVRAESAVMLVYVIGFQLSRFRDAREWAQTAAAVLQRLGGHELLRAWLHNDLGAVYFAEGQGEAAVRSMRESIEEKKKALGPQHPDVGVSEGNVAIFLAELGRYNEALVHIERSLALLEGGLGAAHPDLALQLANHGEILNALGRPREALRSFERAREIWERELGTEHRSLADALTGIGVSYLAEGDPKQALTPLERAFEIRVNKETNPSKRAETEFALARALWALNRDRSRAHSLAVQAREGFQRADAKVRLIEIEGWLRTRGSG
jgi:tetratricopeptide (TPR) repeat protein